MDRATSSPKSSISLRTSRITCWCFFPVNSATSKLVILMSFFVINSFIILFPPNFPNYGRILLIGGDTMSKKYNIGKKSDMRKLNRELKNQAEENEKDTDKKKKVESERRHGKIDTKV